MAATRDFLQGLYDSAVAAALPETWLAEALPNPPPHADLAAGTARIVLLAGGKAAASMLAEAERHYVESCGVPLPALAGLAVTRHGYGGLKTHLPIIEAGHPVPDAAGLEGAEKILAAARAAGPKDLVVVLLSGGASANLIAPAEGVGLADKQALTKALLRSGAPIGELNTVRKHLSRIKGGRLAAAAAPARLVTLAVSDVPLDDPSVIGSGPTVPDPTTLAEARAILEKRGIVPPPSIAAALADPASESPKPGDPAFAGATYRIVATPADSVAAARRFAEDAGYAVIDLGGDVEGEAREVAAAHAARAIELARQGKRAVILSGGELTVTIKGKGRGGPNQEYALALAIALSGHPAIAAVAGDTDGTDGGGGSASDPAGAFVDPTTLARAAARGIVAADRLADNDSTGFFEAIGDLLTPGPTRTNVNDIRAIVIDG